MTPATQPAKEQSVLVVEADIFDRMNETKSLIAQRAYEIYESRGRSHGFDQDDWFKAEGELLPEMDVDYHVTDSSVRLTATVSGFEARDLEVEVGHRRAVICAVHPNSNRAADSHRKGKKIMRIVELPFDVDPASVRASLRNGTLQVVLPRSL